jgi:hypothetical protein
MTTLSLIITSPSTISVFLEGNGTPPQMPTTTKAGATGGQDGMIRAFDIDPKNRLGDIVSIFVSICRGFSVILVRLPCDARLEPNLEYSLRQTLLLAMQLQNYVSVEMHCP